MKSHQENFFQEMEPVRYRVGPRITASIVAVSAVALFMAGVLSGSSSNFSLRQTLQQVDVMSSDAPPPEDNLACGDQCGSCGEVILYARKYCISETSYVFHAVSHLNIWI